MVWYWFKDHTSFRTRDAKGRFDMIWHMFCSQTVLYISWYLNLLTPAYSSVLTHQLYLKNMKTVHFHFLLVDRSWPVVTGHWVVAPRAARLSDLSSCSIHSHSIDHGTSDGCNIVIFLRRESMQNTWRVKQSEYADWGRLMALAPGVKENACVSQLTPSQSAIKWRHYQASSSLTHSFLNM